MLLRRQLISHDFQTHNRTIISSRAYLMPKRVEVLDRVQVAYSKLLEDFGCMFIVAYRANVHLSALVDQAIHLLMESLLLGFSQNNIEVVVGAVAQLDKLCGFQ